VLQNSVTVGLKNKVGLFFARDSDCVAVYFKVRCIFFVWWGLFGAKLADSDHILVFSGHSCPATGGIRPG
jgi:hypothetical protein